MLPEEAFRELIRGVNEGLQRAYDPKAWRNVLDGVVGVVTGWVSDDLGLSGGRRAVGRVEDWVEGWNREWAVKYAGEGDAGQIRVIPLARTGFMTLDIQIPDPRIGWNLAGDEEEAQSQRGEEAVVREQGEGDGGGEGVRAQL